MFDDAREAAKELDAEFAEKGAIRGPLHGVPFSIKVRYDAPSVSSQSLTSL